MKKFLFLLILPFLGCATSKTVVKEQKDVKTYVMISTEYGEIKLMLYDETPLHRDNFLKNVKEGVYDSLLFHRVIKDFMVQGGDPDSKKAKAGVMLGNGGLNYTVPAEFNSKFFHKKGALCAARQGDDVNPLKASSSTQFYIVQGQTFDSLKLQKMEARVNQMTQNAIFFELLNLPENLGYKKRFEEAKTAKDQVKTMEVYNELKEKIIALQNERGGEFKFSATQKEIYKTSGGAPHLDGNYTVFGEVVSGLDVIDKIAAEAVDGNSRPVKDIRFSMKIVYE